MKPALVAIADWATSIDRATVPEDVRRTAISCLVDTVGVGLAGTRTSVAKAAYGLVREVSGAGCAETFVARSLGAAPAAAFANASASHALDFDDNSYAGFVHGSAVIVPAALAVAQRVGCTGEELITAIVAGSEAQFALGIATTNSFYDRGWWSTSVLGPVGACVASSYLLRLGPDRMARALGMAITATGGMKAALGTDAKPLNAGRASEAGVVASLLALRGATGPVDAIESKSGFSALIALGDFQREKLELPGAAWRLLDPGIDVKRVPVCLSSHAAVDAALELAAEHQVRIQDIAQITCDVPPIVMSNLIYSRPESPQQAQFSMEYAVAASLHFGEFGLLQLEPEAIKDDAVQALSAIVEMISSDRWTDPEARRAAPEGAAVEMTLKDGRRFLKFRAYPRGSARDPLLSSEIDAKFLACCNYGGVEDGQDILLRLRTIASRGTVGSLFSAV